ncbi:hypothetical protein Q75_16880 [Bacillus coahuilensis p1.1.43]|uniref:RNA polymerase subunit sigma-24 n=1 Tax=Bacillus coahuilensis p1.1.43 TaxID=1150625 RepID=A0A147K3W5_9BACI|nr:sigma-70 family RNA polymerase sigma factor [Bacillus coahuilensis]KUP03991.1 hypothetical protein Q75_16880 [Bacillus coahuilensis p1.1.43]
MSNERLVKKAKKGHHPSFMKLMKEYELTLYRVARGIVKHEHDCADVVQETILKCYKNLPSLREEKYFKTWLIRICIHECYQILDSRKSIIHMEFKLESSENNMELDLKLAIHEAVATLNEPLKTVTVLYYFEDLSIREISDIESIPEGTVKSRLSTARKQLHTFLEQKKSLYKGVD